MAPSITDRRAQLDPCSSRRVSCRCAGLGSAGAAKWLLSQFRHAQAPGGLKAAPWSFPTTTQRGAGAAWPAAAAGDALCLSAVWRGQTTLARRVIRRHPDGGSPQPHLHPGASYDGRAFLSPRDLYGWPPGEGFELAGGSAGTGRRSRRPERLALPTPCRLDVGLAIQGRGPDRRHSRRMGVGRSDLRSARGRPEGFLSEAGLADARRGRCGRRLKPAVTSGCTRRRRHPELMASARGGEPSRAEPNWDERSGSRGGWNPRRGCRRAGSTLRGHRRLPRGRGSRPGREGADAGMGGRVETPADGSRPAEQGGDAQSSTAPAIGCWPSCTPRNARLLRATASMAAARVHALALKAGVDRSSKSRSAIPKCGDGGVRAAWDGCGRPSWPTAPARSVFSHREYHAGKCLARRPQRLACWGCFDFQDALRRTQTGTCQHVAGTRAATWPRSSRASRHTSPCAPSWTRGVLASYAALAAPTSHGSSHRRASDRARRKAPTDSSAAHVRYLERDMRLQAGRTEALVRELRAGRNPRGRRNGPRTAMVWPPASDQHAPLTTDRSRRVVEVGGRR